MGMLKKFLSLGELAFSRFVGFNGVVQKRERGQSTHSNKIGLHGGTGWVDLVERWLGRYG